MSIPIILNILGMMILPWYSNDYIPSIFPLILYTYHFPIRFPFYSHYIPMLFPLYSHCFPILFPLYSHHFPIWFPCYSHVIPRTSPFFLFLPLTWRPRLFLSALNSSASSLGSRLPCLAAVDCAKEGPLGRATRCVGLLPELFGNLANKGLYLGNIGTNLGTKCEM